MNEREIFTAALEIAGASERSQYLDAACGDDPALRQRVEALLAEHQKDNSFLLDSPPPGLGATVGRSSLSETPGTQIGPYKLLQQIGEGGMGVVWMAEQTQPVQRKVALKVIKPGMDSRQVIARFEAERQALAMMDHVNIARVLDAGTTESGLPYFVMELVHGVPITKYCDDNHLTPRERLELFVPVCQAIQHAHQKGIIHRDIKPSNVMITHYDGNPVPKVIDFGVAKATDQQLTERTLFTQYGTMVGTLEYMSPEQAEMSALGVDTRSDIFSLGVLLYELLTGSTPLTHKRLKEAAFAEVLRMIKEEEPPKPSTRLTESGESLASISAQRHMEPAKLTKLVRGELDWIVMKTLDKDRNRRYETANGLAQDLQHYLADEPVLACPPSKAYRLRKFARKNRKLLATLGAFAVLLIAAAGLSTWQWRETETQRERAENKSIEAEANFQRARKAVDEYFTLVSESKLLDVPGMQPLRKELLEAALRYYQAMRNERADDPAVLADLAVAHLRVSVVYHELDRNDDAVAAVELAIPLAERLHRDYPHAVEQHRRLAGYWKVHRGISSSTAMPKDPVAAHRTLTRFLQLWETFARENPSWEAFQNDVAAINNLLAALESGRGAAGEPAAFTRAIDYDSKAIAIWEQLSQAHPDVPRHRENLARAYSEIAWQFGRAGQKDQAREASARATALQEKLIAQLPNVPTYRDLAARRLMQVASGLADSKPREAEQAFRQALQAWQKLAADFPAAHEYIIEFARAQFKFAVALAGPLKRPDDAISVFREGNEKLKKLAAEYPAEPRYQRELATAPRELASRLSDLKVHLGKAEKLHLQSLAALNELAREFPQAPEYVEMAGHSYRYLGWIARDTGRPDEAIAYFENGIVAFQKLADADIPQRDGFYRGYQAGTLEELALVLAAGGRYDEAEDTYRKALAVFEKSATDSPDNREYRAGITRSQANLIDVLFAQNKQAAAASELRKSQALWRAISGPELERLKKAAEADPTNGNRWRDLAIAFYRSGKWQDSLDIFKTKEHLGHGIGGSAWQWFYIAMAHWQLDHKEEAYSWYYQSIDSVETAQEKRLHGMQAEAAALMDLPDPRQRSERAWEYSQTGTDLEKQGQRDKANEAYGKAIDLYEKLLVDFPAVPAYRTKLVDLLNKTGRGKDVERVDREAISNLEKLAAAHPKIALYRLYLVHSYQALANYLCYEINQKAAAEKIYRESVLVREGLVADFPDNRDYQFHLAHGHLGLAFLFEATGRFPEAEKAYRQALVAFEKVSAQSPKEPAYRIELATYLDRMGILLMTAKKLEEAEKTYRQAVAVWEKLANDLPADDWPRHELAYSHYLLGDLLKNTNRSQEAEQAYGKALALQEQLLAGTPTSANYRGRLALYHVNRGNVYATSSQWDNAFADYTKAIELKPDAWEAWSGRAFVHFRREQWDKAVSDFSKAIDLAPQVHTNWWHRGHSYLALAQWDKAAADFGKVVDQWPDGAEGWYWRGVAFAQLNQPDKAVADLRQAIAKGFNNVEQMKTDPRLDLLRTRKDFGKLLEEMEGQGKSKK